MEETPRFPLSLPRQTFAQRRPPSFWLAGTVVLLAPLSRNANVPYLTITEAKESDDLQNQLPPPPPPILSPFAFLSPSNLPILILGEVLKGRCGDGLGFKRACSPLAAAAAAVDAEEPPLLPLHPEHPDGAVARRCDRHLVVKLVDPFATLAQPDRDRPWHPATLVGRVFQDKDVVAVVDQCDSRRRAGNHDGALDLVAGEGVEISVGDCGRGLGDAVDEIRAALRGGGTYADRAGKLVIYARAQV